MVDFIKKISPEVPDEDKSEFKVKKFRDNNLRILILSVFLVFEQAYYGYFIQPNGSIVEQLYFISASLMVIFAIISAYFQVKKPEQIKLLHKIYEISIGLTGLTIAIMRILFSPQQVFRLPTIYIAVLYGMAVYFYYNYQQSFALYLVAILALIYFVPIFKPNLKHSYYVADAISNGLLAWLVSIFNYRKYVKDFLNKKLIQKKNQQLKDKNEEIKEINQKLEELIIKDDLTKIYNRRKLDDELEKICARAQRYEQIFSLVLLDIDHFKLVNDQYGHNVGDEVLKEFSQLLLDNIRDVDICGRWGGEEFLIISPATECEEALDLAERLRRTIASNDFTKVDNLTSSLGVATYKENDDIESLIKRVDDCLYQAKDEGRNKVISQKNLN
ncbi:GGDEF domain-containing protein [Halanaerobacter jeridensis]|uniref:Diguanylate cyclase (GGDEF)-like protein n=1 Tax=Halanaerobacter jeridensis TaxID=706427 RepID=A0A939BMU5_9FIRM|nr:diguanylate cyclase [Halanaerobacter jeridensis]MBM7557525.1 diguanylate cyclase (GGDEF)-like protein [Halanaerobacter jeridensis]